MVNKSVVYGCTSGYKTNKEKVSSFEFLIHEKWILFVNRRNWTLSKSSVICIKHLKDDFINFGKKNTLKWELESFPTIFFFWPFPLIRGCHSV